MVKVVDVTRTVDPLASLPEPNFAEIKYGIIVRCDCRNLQMGLGSIPEHNLTFFCATFIFHVAGGRCSLILDL